MARPPKSGNKSSLNPKRTSATDSRARLGYGHPEWKMIRLREEIEEHKKQFGSPLPDDCLSARDTAKAKRQYLSSRKAANDETARQIGYVLQDEIDMLWRTKAAEFERAVLEGDYKWFERQAKAIKGGNTHSHFWFEAAVAYRLEMCFWKTRIDEGNDEDVTPETAGKRVGYTARQILNLFETETRKDRYGRERFYVRDHDSGKEYDFERAGRADDAIKKIAKALGYELKQPPKAKTSRATDKQSAVI